MNMEGLSQILDALDTFTVDSMMCQSVCDCSIPISLVGHVVVSPQLALLSEKERVNGSNDVHIFSFDCFSLTLVGISF